VNIKRTIYNLLSALGLHTVKECLTDRMAVEALSMDTIRKCSTAQIQDIVSNSSSELFTNLLRHQIASKWSIIDHLNKRIHDSTTDLKCPICGFSGHTEFMPYQSYCIFGGGSLIRYQCPQCDVIFGDNKMLSLSDAELMQEYEWHYKAYKEGDSTDSEIRAFHCLNPSKDGVYLNYGAGSWSKSVSILRGQGWNVIAYEPHSSAATGVNNILTSRDDLREMRFDGIYSNNVLEHLQRPIDELQFLSGLLKDGGTMSHVTPCFSYLYEYTRFHLFFYLGRSRLVLAKRSDVEIVKFISDGEFMCCLMRNAKK